MDGDKLSAEWCQPTGLMQVVGREGGVVVRTAMKTGRSVGKNSNRCSNEAQENLYMSQVGERKGNKVQYMIDKCKTQQWGGGSYSPVLQYGKTMC